MSIGERISELRKQQNLSQGQLAQALDVTRQAVSKWENDLAVPDALKMIHLADLLDTDHAAGCHGQNHGQILLLFAEHKAQNHRNQNTGCRFPE